MKYKVIPFSQTKNINQELQDILDINGVDGWEYVSHNYSHYLRPGTSGCFGIGSRPDEIWHVGHVVFKKN